MALSLLIFQENSCRWILIKYSCELPSGFCILEGFLRALHPSIAANIDFDDLIRLVVHCGQQYNSHSMSNVMLSMCVSLLISRHHFYT